MTVSDGKGAFSAAQRAIACDWTTARFKLGLSRPPWMGAARAEPNPGTSNGAGARLRSAADGAVSVNPALIGSGLRRQAGGDEDLTVGQSAGIRLVGLMEARLARGDGAASVRQVRRPPLRRRLMTSRMRWLELRSSRCCSPSKSPSRRARACRSM